MQRLVRNKTLSQYCIPIHKPHIISNLYLDTSYIYRTANIMADNIFKFHVIDSLSMSIIRKLNILKI